MKKIFPVILLMTFANSFAFADTKTSRKPASAGTYVCFIAADDRNMVGPEAIRRNLNEPCNKDKPYSIFEMNNALLSVGFSSNCDY